MVGGAHVPRDAVVTGDRVGFPALAVAHSRKVQKGEDFDLAEVAVTWRPTREGGSREDAEDEIEFGAFGLFDGHGGRACAAHCAERFLPELVAALDAEAMCLAESLVGGDVTVCAHSSMLSNTQNDSSKDAERVQNLLAAGFGYAYGGGRRQR